MYFYGHAVNYLAIKSTEVEHHWFTIKQYKFSINYTCDIQGFFQIIRDVYLVFYSSKAHV